MGGVRQGWGVAGGTKDQTTLFIGTWADCRFNGVKAD